MASATVARLNIHLGANSTAVAAGLLPAQSSLAAIGNQVRMLQGIFAGLAAGSALGLGVKMAAEAETAQVSFQVMLRSVEKAKQLLAELKDFATATPFEFPELRDAARMLVAFGIESQDVVTHLRRIGDVSSGIGAPIGEIAELYGKARVQGRLFAQDINQLTGRGIPIIGELAKQFGVAEGEVRSLVEGGQVSFANLEKAFASMSASGGQFAGLMAVQSETLAGRFSTLSDTAKMAAMNFGTALAPALSKLIEAAIPLVDTLARMNVETIQQVIKLTAWAGALTAIVVIVPKIVAGVMSIVRAMQSMAKAQAIIQALSGPKGWAQLAIGLAAAAGAAYLIDQAFADVEKSANAAADATKKVAAGPAINEASIAAQMAESLKARQDAEQALQAMKQKGESLAQSLRTPLEKFVDAAREAGKLAEAGAISGETYARAMEAAKQELLESEQSARRIRDLQAAPGTAAAERFTGAGLSAINSGRREWDRIAKLAEEDARIQKEQKALLAEANRLAGARPVVKTVNL